MTAELEEPPLPSLPSVGPECTLILTRVAGHFFWIEFWFIVVDLLMLHFAQTQNGCMGCILKQCYTSLYSLTMFHLPNYNSPTTSLPPTHIKGLEQTSSHLGGEREPCVRKIKSRPDAERQRV